jgi:5'-methylthioadenosine phosphorylase
MPIGVIGGSGLYEMSGLTGRREETVDTPFGPPSDAFILGTLNGRDLVFLPRHGRGHRIPPSDLNYRANIFGMKTLGVDRILSVSAVGSMKEEIVPGHIVIPDQFFDRTRGRKSTFFSENIVAHIQFADPLCPDLMEVVYDSAREAGATAHKGGTYLCMEGPAFSTRAESRIYRSWGVDVIGMTNLTEAKLAREAEICYVTIALATDYDCWHEEEVSVEAVIKILQDNVAMAREIIARAVPKIPETRICRCQSALKNAIITNPDAIPPETKKNLRPIIGKYIS